MRPLQCQCVPVHTFSLARDAHSSSGTEVGVSADVVLDVQTKVVATIQVAVDACGKIQADVNAINLSLSECASVAAQLAACIQVVTAAFAKVTLTYGIIVKSTEYVAPPACASA
jgi:hypothetical protein